MNVVFAYLRVSGKGQVNGDGFPRQRAAIETYCQAHDLEVKDWFEEEGVSGTLPGEYRPAWLRLWNALEANGTKTVIIERLDRLARDLMIQETLLADLRKNGFEIISTVEPDLASNEPTRTLIRQVLGAVAQYDKAMLVAKLRGARDRKSKARGYRREGGGRFGVTADEMRILTRMRELKTQGLNYSAIAEKLNAEGHKTKTGSRWFSASVNRTLAREIPPKP